MKKFLLFLYFGIALMFSACNTSDSANNDQIMQSEVFIKYKDSFEKTLEAVNRPNAIELRSFMVQNGLYDKYDHVCDLVDDPLIRKNKTYLNYYSLQCERFKATESVKKEFGLSNEEFIEVLRYERSVNNNNHFN